MVVSQATEVASQASATGMILTCDAILWSSKPIVADAHANAPCVSESIDTRMKSQIDFEKRMIRQAMKCWIGTDALLFSPEMKAPHRGKNY